MKVAVISNLHGNLIAISAFLSEMEKLREKGESIDKIYVLGVFGYFPYPKEVCELISGSNGYIVPVRGLYDHAIARFSDEKEELVEELSELEYKIVEWNFEKLGRNCRKWLRNDVPAFLLEKFGNNDIFFVYGSPFNPISGQVKPKQPTAYYENIMAPFRKYEMIVVAGKEEFLVETRYGKIVCPGTVSFYQKERKPTYAIIDTRSLDVHFGAFDFKKSEVEGRIKEENLPEEALELLYHGKVS